MGYELDTKISDIVISLVQSNQTFSDILIQEDQKIVIRHSRGLQEVTDWEVERSQLEEFFVSLDTDWKTKIKTRAFDKAREIGDYRVRANCFKFMGGQRLGSVIRKFPGSPLSFDEIGLNENARRFATIKSGLILIVGDTCQGKSTTLASLINDINTNRSGHILTIEDPIETIIPRKQCVITQREVGEDVESFYTGALDALRERPDVVMFGEIRDADTAKEALLLSESGPVVFGTLHAKSSLQAISKYLGLLNEDKQSVKSFAKALKGIVSQTLVPSKTGNGYSLAAEVLVNNEQISKFIADNKLDSISSTFKSMSSEVQGSGMCTLDAELARLVKEGKALKDDAEKFFVDKEDFIKAWIG